jgi:acetyl esterase/lipase
VRERAKNLLDPEIAEAIASVPSVELTAENFAEQRASANTVRLDYAGNMIRRVHRAVHHVPSSVGLDIRTVVYVPEGVEEDAPVLLHVHGGGMVMGLPEMFARRDELLASNHGCIVVTPDYRKAPETPGPGGVKDCYDVLRWIEIGGYQNGKARPKRIVAMGESGGGGIMAGCALLARDEGFTALSAQILLSPMLDDRSGADVAASGPYGDLCWSAANNQFCWAAVKGSAGLEQEVSPYISPARATDLSNLPPTYLSVGQLDLFMKEALDYGSRLADAGVPVELHLYSRVPHAFGCVVNTNVARRASRDFEDFLGRSLQGTV